MRFSRDFKRSALRWVVISALTATGAVFPAVASAQSDDEESGQILQANAVTLGQLLDAFAGMPGLEADFIEEKQLGMLAMPLTSSGTLYFTQPGLLHRRVDEPRPSTVVITPDLLRFTDESGTEEIDLRARDDVRLFVESLVWVLAGDRVRLDEAYETHFVPLGSAWTLTLTPRDSPLSDIIATMVMRGNGLEVNTIEVTETAGDVTTTQISSANPARIFDDAERGELFGVSEQ
ncbi:MAG: hypothetical protein ACJAYU_002995 [Bradymonadia bacterium]|jgi:hypothetical protein